MTVLKSDSARENAALQFRQSKKRNGRIDFLRFLFAFIVLMHHSRYLLGDDNCYFLGGSLGVEFFFLVSGYLMMASLEKIIQKNGGEIKEKNLAYETIEFIKRKITSILPQYPIAWFIGFCVVMFLHEYSLKKAARKFVAYFWEFSLMKMTGIFENGIDGVIWYISAMLISMAILYPLIRKWPEMMRMILCPLIALMLLGITCGLDGNPRNPTKWYGIIYKGNLRAFAEICLGITMFRITQRIKKVDWTLFSKILFETIQILCYVSSIIYMYYDKPGKQDYFYMFLLYIAVSLSFAQVGILSKLFNNSLSYFLGRISTAIFFSHIYYAQNLNMILPDNLGKNEKMFIYIACSIVTAIIVEYLSFIWRKYSCADRISRIFVRKL